MNKLAAPKLCVGAVAPLFLPFLATMRGSISRSTKVPHLSYTVFALCTPPAARSRCNYIFDLGTRAC